MNVKTPTSLELKFRNLNRISRLSVFFCIHWLCCLYLSWHLNTKLAKLSDCWIVLSCHRGSISHRLEQPSYAYYSWRLAFVSGNHFNNAASFSISIQCRYRSRLHNTDYRFSHCYPGSANRESSFGRSHRYNCELIVQPFGFLFPIPANYGYKCRIHTNLGRSTINSDILGHGNAPVPQLKPHK